MFRSCLFASALLLGGCTAPTPSPAAQPEAGAPPQIEWQRSLDDALALARLEQRPLLLALNMDGESASDRIVRENYRDPAFVASTQRCVCVVGSVFRHNPRDHDDQGRRIPCPRLGAVTCGEHMAMEPALFERLLADGERVAPRHAVVMQDGGKAFDMSLNFDLCDIDRALAQAVRGLPPRDGAVAADASWQHLAARRDHAGRTELEARLLRADAGGIASALAAIRDVGDAGAIEALALLSAFRPAATLRADLLRTVRARGIEVRFANAMRERLGAWLVLGLHGVDWLPVIAALDPAGAATRTWLLAHRVLPADSQAATSGLRAILPAPAMADVEAALLATGGTFDLSRELDRMPAERLASPTGDQMAPPDVLERTLADLEAVAAAARDAAHYARFAKASLDLGRHRLEAQRRDAQVLFEDAELHWQRALDREPRHAEWWIERARTAYFLGRFADEAAAGERAFAVATGQQEPASPLHDATAVEALRWVADGHARVLDGLAAADAASQQRSIALAMRGFGRVAASAHARAKDWLSLASFCGALGLVRQELEIVRLGAQHFPTDRELRQHLIGVFWSSGHVRTIATIADEIAYLNAGNADVHWYAGYARLLVAEHGRRTEQPAAACADYELARTAFQRAISLQPDYRDDCLQMIALGWLGQGHAHALAGDRAAAAECLVDAVRLRVGLAAARDGLGYDVLDLVDKIFEWRATGASPVEPIGLLGRLLALAPEEPFFGLAIADSLLREALRADGRNPVRALRDTVDAGGRPVRMELGLPTAEGDAYLQDSLRAALAVRHLAKSDEDKRVLAQSATIQAERLLARDRIDGVASALAEAALVLGLPGPAAGADAAALRAFAGQLRAQLGEARPRQRDGR